MCSGWRDPGPGNCEGKESLRSRSLVHRDLVRVPTERTMTALENCLVSLTPFILVSCPISFLPFSTSSCSLPPIPMSIQQMIFECLLCAVPGAGHSVFRCTCYCPLTVLIACVVLLTLVTYSASHSSVKWYCHDLRVRGRHRGPEVGLQDLCP